MFRKNGWNAASVNTILICKKRKLLSFTLLCRSFVTNKNLLVIFVFFFIASICTAQTGIWTELHPTNSPSPRDGFGMAEIGNEKAIIFGGSNSDSVFDETWMYDYKKNTWTKINTIIHPSKRYDLRMSKLTTNKILLFGGWLPSGLINGGYYNDTWIFDLDSLTWNEIKPINNPSPRENFGLTQLIDGKVLLFGGDTVDLSLANDTWIFSIDSNNWKRILLNFNDEPPQCEGAMLAQIDTGKVLFYGGWHYEFLNETWLFDYNLIQWIMIEPKSNSIPIANSSMSNISKNEVVLWGGDTDSEGHYDEMWLFNLIDSSWKNIPSNVKPDGRYLHRIINFGENNILLFGGLNNLIEVEHNDTWLFKLLSDGVEDNLFQKNIPKFYLIQNNTVHIQTNINGILNYRLYDIYGKVIIDKQDKVINGYLDFDTYDLTNGLYFLVEQCGQKSEVIKILLER
jgi:hypothetical protein